MLHPEYPIFPQPYQIGADRIGGSWIDYNEVFVVQVASCNLDCWYCFVDEELRRADTRKGDWFSAQDVIDMWVESGTKVLRVSGGEPTLAPEFLMDLIQLMSNEDGILWIDTNLMFDDRLISLLKTVTLDEAYGVVFSGCFKGWTTGSAWEQCRAHLCHQLEAAHKLVKETSVEVFFYIPDTMTPEIGALEIAEFFHRLMDEVDPMAPLRTYVLHVKDYTSTESALWSTIKQTVENGVRPIDLWKDLCEQTYGPELNWIPNHQVTFVNRVPEPFISNL
jgi:uncharacterized Fe-S cluster-containing radical SAM superfamily protein